MLNGAIVTEFMYTFDPYLGIYNCLQLYKLFFILYVY